MVHTFGRTAAVAAAMTLALTGAFGEEPAPAQELPGTPASGTSTEPVAPSEPPGPPPVDLALPDAVRMAVERNLDLQLARLEPRLRQEELTSAQSIFDPSLFGNASRSRSNSRATSAFSTEGSSTFDTINGGITKLFGTGATATLAVDNNRSAQQLGTEVFQFASPTYDSSVRFSFNQPLLKGWMAVETKNNLVISRNNLEVSRTQVRRRVENSIRDVTRAYWDLRAAQSSLTVAREALDLAQNLLKLNKAKVEVGTLAPIEITQAEAGVASREEAVIIAENAIRTAEDELRRLLNPPRDSDLWMRPINPVQEPQFEPVDINLQSEVDAALKNRQELEEQRVAVRNLELQSESDRASYRPQLDFVGSYGLSGTAGDTRSFLSTTACSPGNPNCTLDANNDGTVDSRPILIPPTDQGFSDSWDQITNADLPSWSVGLQASYPIGNRAAKAAYARSRVAVEQGNLEVQSLEQSIEIEVRNAARQVQTNAKRVQAARVNMDLQRKKLEAEQKRFQYGMTTSFQVLEFQNDLTSAQSAMVSAALDYNKSLVDLAAATGTLLEKQGIEVE